MFLKSRTKHCQYTTDEFFNLILKALICCFAVVLDSKAIDSNQPMNALMRLNQIRPGLQYRLLSQSGPVHAPVFTMSVDVDGSNYEASGSSKKTAKLHVAVKVRWKSEKGMSSIACVCWLNQYLQTSNIDLEYSGPVVAKKKNIFFKSLIKMLRLQKNQLQV